jgi:hypothetical protein
MSIGIHIKPNLSGETKPILSTSTMHDFSHHRVQMLILLKLRYFVGRKSTTFIREKQTIDQTSWPPPPPPPPNTITINRLQNNTLLSLLEREFYCALFSHFFKVTCPDFSTAPLINSRSTAHLYFTNSFATLKEEATTAINILVAVSSSNA